MFKFTSSGKVWSFDGHQGNVFLLFGCWFFLDMQFYYSRFWWIPFSNAAFGQSSSSPFGSSVFGQTSSPNNNPFAPKPFGSPNPFGSQTGSSLFGGTSTGVFGQPSTPAFGASSSPAFGSSTPAFGASSTPAFGSSSSSFGGKNQWSLMSIRGMLLPFGFYLWIHFN